MEAAIRHLGPFRSTLVQSSKAFLIFFAFLSSFLAATPSVLEKKPEPLLDNFGYFQDKEDDLHRHYNDHAYLNSEDLARDDGRIGMDRAVLCCCFCRGRENARFL